MTALTMAAFRDALEDHYTPAEIRRVVYTDRPFLAILRKEENWKGDRYIQPLIHEEAIGRSKTFATAQANTRPGKYERFEVDTVDDYGVIHVDLETILASEGQPVEYFVQSRISEMDGILNSLGESMSTDLFGNTGGARGQRGSLAGNIVTLLNIENIVNFSIGQLVKASANDGETPADVLRAGTAVEITSIDRDLGTLTASGTWAGITAFADNDFLFTEGDFQGAMAGLASWLPPVAPTATLFFGVDRSVDTQRLGGQRYSDTLPIVEKLQRAAATGRRHSARFDMGVMNPVHWADLDTALGDKARYQIVEDETGEFGFEALIMRTPAGRIRYMEDPHCPPGVIYHLTERTWKFASRGPAPQVLDPDGVGNFLRRTNDPGVEGRFGYFGNLINEAPGWNQVITGVPF